MVSTANYRSAAEALGNSSAQSAAAPGVLEGLDRAVDLAAMVPELPAGLSSWIVGQLAPIEKALDLLTGDAGAVAQWADGCQRVADGLTSHADSMETAGNGAQWDGKAGDGFRAHVAAEKAAATAAAGVWRSLAATALSCGGAVGEIRQRVEMVGTSLVSSLVASAQSVAPHATDPIRWAQMSTQFLASAEPAVQGAVTEVQGLVQAAAARGAQATQEFRRAANSFNRAAALLGGSPGAMTLAGNKAPMTPPDGRESLDDVLKNNQVKEDEVIEWSPGFPLNLFTDAKKITATEGRMLDKLGAFQLKDFKDIHDQAFDKADEVFPSTPDAEQNDDHNDAYRHALWSAKLAKRFGPDWAEDYTTAHERLPENPAVREAMDLHNNGVGIQVVRDNPNASDEEIAEKIKEAVENGDTVVVNKQGNLEWSDRVPRGETGHPSNEELPGKDPGEPDKSAKS